MEKVGIIPQFFYDLIARLIPGAILLGSTALVVFGPNPVRQHLKDLIWKRDMVPQITFLLVIYVFFGSFLIAILMRGVEESISKLQKYYYKYRKIDIVKTRLDQWQKHATHTRENVKLASRCMSFCSQPCLSCCNDTKERSFPSLAFVYDAIRLAAPKDGARMVKLRAQRTMCSTLVIGWVLLVIANLMLNKSRFNSDMLAIDAFLALSVLFVSYYKSALDKRFYEGLCNHWCLLSMQNKLFLCPNKSNESETES